MGSGTGSKIEAKSLVAADCIRQAPREIHLPPSAAPIQSSPTTPPSQTAPDTYRRAAKIGFSSPCRASGKPPYARTSAQVSGNWKIRRNARPHRSGHTSCVSGKSASSLWSAVARPQAATPHWIMLQRQWILPRLCLYFRRADLHHGRPSRVVNGQSTERHGHRSGHKKNPRSLPA